MEEIKEIGEIKVMNTSRNEANRQYQNSANFRLIAKKFGLNSAINKIQPKFRNSEFWSKLKNHLEFSFKLSFDQNSEILNLC